MNKTILNLLPILLLLIVSGFLINSANKNRRINEDLIKRQNTLDQLNAHLKLMEDLGMSDRELFNLNLEAAYQNYDRLQQFDTAGLITDNVAERKIFIRQLQQMQRLLDSNYQNVIVDTPLVQPLLPIRSEVVSVSDSRQTEVADSLRFALEKAQMQLKSLRNQNGKNTGGNYLTFSSSKGDSIYYIGQVINKKANGVGVGLISTGSRYVGDWQNNMRHGIGTFYWLDGASYDGEYVNDKRQGDGTYKWPNGEWFEGQWADDKRNGQGTFYAKDGKVVASGLWENDQLLERGKK